MGSNEKAFNISIIGLGYKCWIENTSAMTPTPKHWSETESKLDDAVYLIKALTGPVCILGSLGLAGYIVLTGQLDLKHIDLAKTVGGNGILGGSILTALTRKRNGGSLLDVAAGMAAQQLAPNTQQANESVASPISRYTRDAVYPDHQQALHRVNQALGPDLITRNPIDTNTEPHDESYYLKEFMNS